MKAIFRISIALSVFVLGFASKSWAPPADMTRAFTCAPTSSTADEQFYEISVLDDEFDDSTGGDCSLREALYDINARGALSMGSGDMKVTVELGAGEYKLNLTGDNEDSGKTGDLDIKRDLIISGQGMDETVLDADGLSDRLFEIHAGYHVTLKNLTLKNGTICDDRSSASACFGGAILNKGDLYLENVHLVENFAYDSDAQDAKGGALYNSGTLILKNSLIDNNMTIDTDGIWKNKGGAIYSAGALVVESSSIHNNSNQGVYGGGLVIDGAEVAIRNSFIGNNVCSSFMLGCSGGAIALFDAPNVQLVNTTIGDNRINVTMTSPSSSKVKAQGGGIFVSGSTLVLQGVTLAHNRCEGPYENVACEGGGLAVSAKSDVSFKNTLVVGNTLAVNGAVGKNDLEVVNAEDSELHSNGKNIMGDIAVDTLALNESDILGVSPEGLLGEFSSRPEPGKSFYALVSGSYAVDAGLTEDCAAGSPLEKDQIDQERSGLSCDIGAVECVNCAAFVATNGDGRTKSSGLNAADDMADPLINISVEPAGAAADPAADPEPSTSYKTFSGGAVFEGGGCSLNNSTTSQSNWPSIMTIFVALCFWLARKLTVETKPSATSGKA